MKPCELDNFETYYTDGIWELNEGRQNAVNGINKRGRCPGHLPTMKRSLFFKGFDKYILVKLTPTTSKLGQAFLLNGVLYTQDQTYGHQ